MDLTRTPWHPRVPYLSLFRVPAMARPDTIKLAIKHRQMALGSAILRVESLISAGEWLRLKPHGPILLQPADVPGCSRVSSGRRTGVYPGGQVGPGQYRVGVGTHPSM